MKDSQNRDVYFARLDNDDELITALHQKIADYYKEVEEMELFNLWLTSYRAYYGANLTGRSTGLSFDSAQLSKGGKQGEITFLKLNHFRNLVTHTLQLTTAQKPALNCRSNNTDYDSQTQTILGNALIDFYFREKKVGKQTRTATETSMIFGEGFIHLPWNPSAGEKYDVDQATQKVIYEGDLDFKVLTPLDVVRDVTVTDEEDHDWYLIKSKANKFDLAADHPKFEDDILNGSNKEHGYENSEAFTFTARTNKDSKDNDKVTIWTFYHRATVSVPKGRLVIFCGDNKLVDTKLPYEKIPVSRVAPAPLMGTIFGWSPAFDLLAPQQALDILNAIITSNQSSFGTQSIWTKSNDPITVTQLGSGMKNFQSEEMPQPVQLTKTAPEIFSFRNELIQEMETLSGINSVVRGQPEASLKSGAALALVVAQAVQFASLLEASYSDLTESVGYSIISTLRDFSKTERVIEIVGQAHRGYSQSFKSNDLNSISRVSMEQTSALSKTISGRLQLAESLTEKGFIDNGREYITVLQTGQLDPIIEGTQASLLNIRAENESLRNGKQVRALITDHHQDHIQEHTSILSSPEARSNEKLAQSVLDHIQEHIDLWRKADPAILFVTGQQPPPPGPQAPPQQGQPQQGQPQPSEIAEPSNQPSPDGMPSQPNMPSLPQQADAGSQAAYEKTLQPK